VRAVLRARPEGVFAQPRWHSGCRWSSRREAQHEPRRTEAQRAGDELPRVGNILTVRDLVTRTEDQLLEVRNFGETTLSEVKEKLNDLGLYLGMRVPSPAK